MYKGWRRAWRCSTNASAPICPLPCLSSAIRISAEGSNRHVGHVNPPNPPFPSGGGVRGGGSEKQNNILLFCQTRLVITSNFCINFPFTGDGVSHWLPYPRPFI